MRCVARSRACGRRFAIVVVALTATQACDQSGPVYHGTLAEWRQDSILVDSLAKGVDTDSLYTAYRAVLTAEDLQSAHQHISCIERSLRLLHGFYPSELAIARMMDTVWEGVDPELLRAYQVRRPEFMALSASDKQCGHPEEWLERRRTLPPAVEQVDPRRRPFNLR